MTIDTHPTDELWPRGPLETYYADFESFAAGSIDEEPSMDHLSPEDQEKAENYQRFLIYKYEEGLDQAGRRRITDPEFIRSTFRVIRGGLSANSGDQA